MNAIVSLVVATLVILVTALGLAQPPGAGAQQVDPGAPEIKLDEATALKAAVVDARMSALLANSALLQRQLQDMQAEWTKMLEERKKLIEDAARKARVEVKEPMEWAFDNKGQRYVKVRKP